MKKIIFIALLAIFCGCKDDAKEEKQTKSDTIIEDMADEVSELSVVVNFKTNRADNIVFKLNNIVLDEFQKKNVQIVEKVSPTTTSDAINAKFGPNNISNNFIIGLGNREVKEIEIESILLSYGKNTLSVTGNELSKHFTLNKFVTHTPETNKIKTNKVDGKHNPSMILKRKSINTLRKE